MKEDEKLQKVVTDFRLPLSIWKELELVAKEKSMSRAGLIRQAIRVGLPIIKAGA